MESFLTIVNAAADLNLVDLATVKDEFGITDSSVDTKLARWIAATSARLADLCDTVFPEQDYSELFRIGTRLEAPWPAHTRYHAGPLRLTRSPATVIATVTEGVTDLAEGTDYETDLGAGLVYRLSSDNRRAWHASKVTIAYTAGYYPIPLDLADAVVTILRHRWFTTGRDPLLRGFTIDGVGSETYWVPLSGGPGELPPDLLPVADTIARYQTISIA